MSEIEFNSTEIPARAKTGRTPMPNPFREVFPSDDKALTFTVPFAEDSTEVRRLVRQAREAAKDVDRSPQVKITETENKGEVETTLTVWTVARITRKPKDETAETE